MSGVFLRRAQPGDALRIINLYQDIYEGNYPDPLMSQYRLLKDTLASREYCWMIAEAADAVVGSVVYRVDEVNRLAKVYGAAVRPEYRGHNLTERLMTEGQAALAAAGQAAEVIYATTRTVAAAPQKLTANLGYKKLGIFPNVHKTADYETHCLTALFAPETFEKRFTDFKLHPKLARLFEITRSECGLPALELAPRPRLGGECDGADIDLEIISAPRFVAHRFRDEKPTVQEHHWFFPFQEPNLLLTSADQSVEIFAYYSEADKHCALIGIRDMNQRGHRAIVSRACRVLRNELGARYLEFIIRADELTKIENALGSEFLPCAYFPAMQRSAAGHRFDYVVFSRSFEILDFHNLKLEGLNREYLIQYYESWKELSLDPILLRT